jgi:hypothetical protein
MLVVVLSEVCWGREISAIRVRFGVVKWMFYSGTWPYDDVANAEYKCLPQPSFR